MQNSQSFPSYRGVISIAPNGRYFQDEDGKGFVVIGHNDAITWPSLEELLEGDADITKAYVADLRAHGITVSRIMLEYAQEQRGLLEESVGTYSQKVVLFWDRFIRLAEQHGLYLLLTPYDTFWQVLHWRQYPYNRSRGGPCGRKQDWLTKRACINAQKQRWEFIIRRYGSSHIIFGWDIMNEIDLYWLSSPEQLYRYISEMAAHIRQLERDLCGRSHMLTVSSAAAVPQGELGEVIYNHPDIDFVNTHLYAGEGVKAPLDTIQGAINIGQAVAASLDAMRHVRPYFDSESGPIDAWIRDQAMDDEYHHNISFAHLAAGGAGSGMRWPYSRPHHLVPSLRANLAGLARFAASIQWCEFSSRNITPWIAVRDECVHAIGSGDGQRLILWFLCDKRRRDASGLEGVQVEVHDVLRDGRYRFDIWETYTGYCFESQEVSVEHGLLAFQLSAPSSSAKDVAVSVYPASE